MITIKYPMKSEVQKRYVDIPLGTAFMGIRNGIADGQHHLYVKGHSGLCHIDWDSIELVSGLHSSNSIELVSGLHSSTFFNDYEEVNLTITVERRA